MSSKQLAKELYRVKDKKPRKIGKQRYFDGKTNQPYSNNVQDKNSKFGYEGPRTTQQKSRCQCSKRKHRGVEKSKPIGRKKGRPSLCKSRQSTSIEPRTDPNASYFFIFPRERGFNDPERVLHANIPIPVGAVLCSGHWGH